MRPPLRRASNLLFELLRRGELDGNQEGSTRIAQDIVLDTELDECHTSLGINRDVDIVQRLGVPVGRECCCDPHPFVIQRSLVLLTRTHVCGLRLVPLATCDPTADEG